VQSACRADQCAVTAVLVLRQSGCSCLTPCRQRTKAILVSWAAGLLGSSTCQQHSTPQTMIVYTAASAKDVKRLHARLLVVISFQVSHSSSAEMSMTCQHSVCIVQHSMQWTIVRPTLLLRGLYTADVMQLVNTPPSRHL